MSDQEDGGAGLAPDSAPRRPSAGASAGPARRKARPAGSAAAPSPACGRCRRAGACRPTAGTGSCGRRAPAPSSSARRSIRASPLALGQLHPPEAEGDVVAADQPGKGRILLEHHADAVRDLPGDRPPLEGDLAARSAMDSPAISSSRVDLPQPDGPTTEKNSTAPQLQGRSAPGAWIGSSRLARRWTTLSTLAQRDLGQVGSSCSLAALFRSSGRKPRRSRLLARRRRRRSRRPSSAPRRAFSSPPRWICPERPSSRARRSWLEIRARTAFRATSGSRL